MAKKSDFSKEEWQLLKDGPEWVFAALAAADGNVCRHHQDEGIQGFQKRC